MDEFVAGARTSRKRSLDTFISEMFDEGNSSLPETKTISGRGLDNGSVAKKGQTRELWV